MEGKGIATWVFNPIALVDSFKNEPESHGFLSFTVKQQQGLPYGHRIENSAAIYFDFNAPIIALEKTVEFQVNGINPISGNFTMPLKTMRCIT